MLFYTLYFHQKLPYNSYLIQVLLIHQSDENNEIKLQGVEFEVLDKDGNVLETITTNQDGEAYTSRYAIRDYEKLYLHETKTNEFYKLNDKQVEVELKSPEEINVIADDFYIEQVITNYLTNAIKHVEEVNGEKSIVIENVVNVEKNKVKIKVFNTGINIKEEDLTRIWNRFYKVDESRNRADGGTGIGLSFVKAIMSNYKNDYGVINKDNGVEFYFELDLKI